MEIKDKLAEAVKRMKQQQDAAKKVAQEARIERERKEQEKAEQAK